MVVMVQGVWSGLQGRIVRGAEVLGIVSPGGHQIVSGPSLDSYRIFSLSLTVHSRHVWDCSTTRSVGPVRQLYSPTHVPA